MLRFPRKKELAMAKPASDQLADFLTALRKLRQKAGKVAGMPPEAITHLEATINLVSNERILKVAGLNIAKRSIGGTVN